MRDNANDGNTSKYIVIEQEDKGQTQEIFCPFVQVPKKAQVKVKTGQKMRNR